MDDDNALSRQFEEHRDHLHRVALRILGSRTEADDALQEVWLRVSRAGTDGIENLGGWLTTITSRVCLNVLRARRVRDAEPLDAHVPELVVRAAGGTDPEQEAVLADAVGLALLVVLDALAPAERLAFVLHDMFAVPFDEIAEVLDRTPEATRQLASRARRRVQGTPPLEADRDRQRLAVDAFFAAARAGDFDALLEVLDPDVVSRTDGGRLRAGASTVVRGAATVAGRAISYSQPGAVLHPVIVNGQSGVVATMGGEAVAVMAFTVRAGRIVAFDAVVDPERIAALDLSFLSG